MKTQQHCINLHEKNNNKTFFEKSNTIKNNRLRTHNIVRDNNKTVINPSKKSLSNAAVNILAKEMKFAVTLRTIPKVEIMS